MEYTISNDTLIFDNSFNEDLTNFKFPNNVHTIRFGMAFNREIDNVHFSDNIHTIEFGTYFNQKLDNVIFSNNLHTIKFGNSFNQKLNNVKFPDSVRKLIFGFYFQNDISFLTQIHSIDLSQSFNAVHPDNYIELPLGLRELILFEGHGKHIKLPYKCIITYI